MKYAIGIDLGTTHTALSFVDLELAEGEEAPPAVFAIPQLVAQGSIDARPLLPSFLYLPHPSEGPQPLPWDPQRGFVVGEHARARGADAPGRVISSAKSWLCHPGIDRRAPVLPPTPAGAQLEAGLDKLSPVEVSRHYISHLREAWNDKVAKDDPDAAFEQQEIVLTVPASFDAAARDLTAEAARAAGIQHLTLLEEPQAALYSWIEQSHGGWRKQVRVGDVILVIDVGGGTTDFSAIAVQEQGGSLQLQRIAVGDHILLGGDNMDLALAHVVRQKLESQGKTLDPWQGASLVHQARVAKETLLGREDLAAAPIVVAGRGSKLLGGAIRTELTREELLKVLVDGFFPKVDATARPMTRARVGLTQLGLGYAQDPAVTRHLASFLARQAAATAGMEGFAAQGTRTLLHPTAVIFNGGVMKGTPLRDRVLETLNAWLVAEGGAPVRVLEGVDLDLSVARGAAYYGYAKRGKGVRIRGGTARAYYVGFEGAVPAVPGLEPPITAMCVAPFGIEEGTSAGVAPAELGLIVGEPVRFRFFGSSVRRDDRVGTMLERWSEGELEELAPIEATLPAENRRPGEVVPVQLASSVTEVGTLLLEALPTAPTAPGAGASNERWRLELNVREPERGG
ncbi:MAG: Hsp70 family protein [Deltaproteobacteria bacterium]|nr:Hsp70 family protein [Deltaproteobacteria bacterium]